ncbi:hypothetical protein ACL02T_24735 [Pseudonocardia sp. RS010]|uniref:hypothetical protein n=1 Tax=Pseudonocardia sp. RS010 TaxID=3385979 RepID=UPI0039A14AFC
MPVATWGALPFHRAALAHLRRTRATMGTLVSLGVLTALGYSTTTLFLGRAGERGVTHPFHLGIGAGDPAGSVLLVGHGLRLRGSAVPARPYHDGRTRGEEQP